MTETIGVGEIPISNYINFYGSHRGYNKELLIEHTKNIYGIDITEECNICKPICFEYITDVIKKFEQENPPSREDDKSREYFNSIARRRYGKFYITYLGSDVFDDVIGLPILCDVVHHIYPLVYGGSNSITNLIGVTKFTHDLLHLNPLEKEEKYCHQAVDYLHYLFSFDAYDKLLTKYKLENYQDNKKLLSKIHKEYIKEEMMKFYKKLELSVQ